MAARDVADALIAMDDSETRQRVIEGDFTALGTLDLTPEEQALISGASSVLPDGHPSKVLVAFEPGEVEAHALTADNDAGYWPAGTARAIAYVQRELDDPQAQARFRGWATSNADKFP
jgi:hypothetical protein